MKTRPCWRAAQRAVLAVALQSALPYPAAAQTASPDEAAANAEPVRPGAAELNEKGLALYAKQDYRHALESFIGAYAFENDPNLLFNMGRCYEQLGQLDPALEKYELFVASTDSDPTAVARARVAIESIHDARRTAATPREVEPAPAAAAPSAPRMEQPSATRSDGLPWLTLGGSVAFAAAGATFYVMGAHDHAQITNLPQYDNPSAPARITWRRADALVHSGDTKKIVGAVSLGVGGVLAATTVVLFSLRGRVGDEEPAVAFEPAALRGGGGMLLAGSFW